MADTGRHPGTPPPKVDTEDLGAPPPWAASTGSEERAAVRADHAGLTHRADHTELTHRADSPAAGTGPIHTLTSGQQCPARLPGSGVSPTHCPSSRKCLLHVSCFLLQPVT